jgi:hypothetical protein
MTKFTRRFLKFLHTASGIGYAGGLAAYMLVLSAAPDIGNLEEYAALRASLVPVTTWLLMPSMLVVLVSGLLAMAISVAYQNAPWVWAKALSGILIFESSLSAIDSPIKGAAEASARAVAGEIDGATLESLVRDEWVAWWILLGLCAANVALAIWRPRFGMRRN